MDSSTSAPTTSEDFLGTTSDYILIAMITAMMMFMTLCCLCLFCRTTSRCTICGFDFEVNDEPTTHHHHNQPAIEDLDEIHEVVPLTPTSRDDYQLHDIEQMLRSGPPPPRYSEVATFSRANIFRWSRTSRKQSSKNLTLPPPSDTKSATGESGGTGGSHKSAAAAKTQRSRSLMMRKPPPSR